MRIANTTNQPVKIIEGLIKRAADKVSDFGYKLGEFVKQRVTYTRRNNRIVCVAKPGNSRWPSGPTAFSGNTLKLQNPVKSRHTYQLILCRLLFQFHREDLWCSVDLIPFHKTTVEH